MQNERRKNNSTGIIAVFWNYLYTFIYDLINDAISIYSDDWMH